MMHKIARHGVVALLRALVVMTALLFGGLALLAFAAGAQAPVSPPTWEARLDSLVRAELERTRTPGAQVAVAHRGRVIFSKGYGVADAETARPVTPQTLFRVGSVTKMITGAMAAEMSARGTLDLNAPISRYVTQLDGREVGTVTTRQLLSHTAGWIDNAVPYGRMGEGALGEVMDEVSDTLFLTDPGRIVSYSNPGFSMAGYVIERAGQQRYGSLAESMILRPMGMPYATFRPLHAMTRDFSQGHVGPPDQAAGLVRPFTENTAQWAAGFLMASAQDMARFAIAVMAEGMLDGTRVLSPEAVRLLTTGVAPIPGDTAAQYAFGLMVSGRPGRRAWRHGGAINGFDAMLTMYPDLELAIVVHDNRGGAPLNGIESLVYAAVSGETPPPPSTPAEPRVANATERTQIAGRYRVGRQNIEILNEGDSLTFLQNGLRMPVRLIGADRMRITPPVPGAQPLTLVLVRNAEGRVEFLSQGLRAIPRVELAR
ncbi:MAG: beta-lactamase family protein [Gemmatimonadaceae bacterium]|nr:beta-lactamase family protein [Gemmatimonadaceae bacterium]MCW5826558.1 beta-lactamase family protein [Gemmatimonadaceae bacterium]